MDLGNGLDSVKVLLSGDMLFGGGANSASVWRVDCTQGKFRELSWILMSKDVPLKLKGKVCVRHVRSAMLYGSEIWAMTWFPQPGKYYFPGHLNVINQDMCEKNIFIQRMVNYLHFYGTASSSPTFI